MSAVLIFLIFKFFDFFTNPNAVDKYGPRIDFVSVKTSSVNSEVFSNAASTEISVSDKGFWPFVSLTKFQVTILEKMKSGKVAISIYNPIFDQ